MFEFVCVHVVVFEQERVVNYCPKYDCNCDWSMVYLEHRVRGCPLCMAFNII